MLGAGAAQVALGACVLTHLPDPALGVHQPRDCAEETGSGLLHGRVREHPSGASLPNVTVSIYGLGVGTTTDVAGTFRIPPQGLESCRYSLVFTAPGHTTVIAGVAPVAPGDSLEVNVALTRLLAPGAAP